MPKRIVEGLKNKAKAVATNLANFAQAKKEQIINKVETSSVWVFLLQWALTHWVTVLLSILLTVSYVRYRLVQEDLREQQLNQELASLNIDLEKMKEERELFLARIKELESIKKKNTLDNKKVRENASKLSPEEQKKLLLEYKSRLIQRRGI